MPRSRSKKAIFEKSRLILERIILKKNQTCVENSTLEKKEKNEKIH